MVTPTTRYDTRLCTTLQQCCRMFYCVASRNEETLSWPTFTSGWSWTVAIMLQDEHVLPLGNMTKAHDDGNANTQANWYIGVFMRYRGDDVATFQMLIKFSKEELSYWVSVCWWYKITQCQRLNKFRKHRSSHHDTQKLERFSICGRGFGETGESGKIYHGITYCTTSHEPMRSVRCGGK